MLLSQLDESQRKETNVPPNASHVCSKNKLLLYLMILGVTKTYQISMILLLIWQRIKYLVHYHIRPDAH